MSVDPRRLSRRLRRVTLALAAVGIGYLFWRYDLERLPADRCSPLARFAPGSTLLVDTRPPGIAEGDAVIVRAEGALALGRVTRVRPEGATPQDSEALWLETDVPTCPTRSSHDFSWVARDAVAARVLLALPW